MNNPNPGKQSMEVFIHADPATSTIAECFGITDDRIRELAESVSDIAITGSSVEAIKRVSRECSGPNELALICFLGGMAVGKREAMTGSRISNPPNQ